MKGVLVGHHERIGGGWLTGTTVLLCPDGAVAGVDVRGGGPGTRETDLLDPRNLVDRVHAVVLSGGSAYGLAAASGVTDWLAERGIGLPVGPGPREVVPIVPAAVLYDLGRGGAFENRPDAEFGRLACADASGGRVRTGNVGAGAGAVAGGVKGGFGHASVTIEEGFEVEAVVAVNAVGSCVDPRTGRLYGDDRDLLAAPTDAEAAAIPQSADVPLATTIGAILTDATLTKAQAQKVAGVAHDGMARAIRPVHSLFDGDTVFTLATGAAPAPDPVQTNAILAAAADVFSQAVVNAILAARSVAGYHSYRDLAPSVFA
ncbi:P1 family peptidase [Actinomadura macrotermitis]|uniref:Putative aminopeptidase n=1 Tax=Actinomadura macrotermitis TaxID=2585200 RepID=A0A7K0BNC2_9ACTN|nr:putative aminopeptidase [Actinomadura macrotermitis]